MAVNKSLKAKDQDKDIEPDRKVSVKEEVKSKQSKGQKAVPETSKGEKVKIKNSSGGGGGRKPISVGRRMTRNSAMAAMRKIKLATFNLALMHLQFHVHT